jgi:kynureninase
MGGIGDSPPRKAPEIEESRCFSGGTIDQTAADLDAADPLASYRDAFVTADGVVAYLDGNSLGRPLKETRERLASFVDGPWGDRLIRAWDEEWMAAPTDLGDTIARVCLGAALGQTVVADSTTVLLYKLVRAAVAARPDRTEIVVDTDNFPTDRFVVEGVAAERGLELRWITPAPDGTVTADQVRAAVSDRTALMLLSHVAYRSGQIADLPAITAIAHEAGALVLWDLCHSVGSVELALDEHQVDLAVGCTYKYLNGGPGAPAFAYLAERHHDTVRQPIQGWMGAADVFAMAERYQPAAGIRQLISGTPPILGMLPMRDMLALIEEVGLPAVRRKSVALTAFAVEVADELLTPYDVRLASPRDPALRGGHVTLDHPDFRELTAALWERGVIPDFRPPHGLRIGLSPLSTSFAEVAAGLKVVAELLSSPRS